MYKLSDGLIHAKDAFDLCDRVRKLTSGGCIKPYPFEPLPDTQVYIMQILADNAKRTITPEDSRKQYTDEEEEVSLQVLKKLRTSLFEDFIRGKGHATEFQKEMGQLTIPDLQQLIHMDQCNLRLTHPSPILCEIITDDKPSENMILQLPNCEQFEVFTRTIRLHNQSDENISFKILNSQKQALLVRFMPWNGEIDSHEVSCGFCMMVMIKLWL